MKESIYKDPCAYTYTYTYIYRILERAPLCLVPLIIETSRLKAPGCL